jgi:hypothetical protein
MKINSIFRVLVFGGILLTFNMSFAALAQRNLVVAQAEADATSDANKDVNKPLWFGTGCLLSGLVFLPLPGWSSCLLPPIGVTGTYFYRPAPPVSRLIGRTPEYVDVYTSTYKSKRGNVQASWASAGCLSGGAAVGLLSLGIGIGIGLEEALGSTE